MDPTFNGMFDSVSSVEFEEDDLFYPSFSDPPYFVNGSQVKENNNIMDRNFMESQFSPPSLDTANLLPSPNIGSETDSPEDMYSNPVLKYLNQILLEENMDDRPSMFHDPLALRATEKSLYDALGEKYQLDHNADSPDSLFGNCSDNSTISNTSNTSSVEPHSVVNSGGYELLPGQSYTLDGYFRSSSQIDWKSFGTSVDGHVDVPAYNNLSPNVFSDSESILQFKKGMEEASRFLPANNQLIIDLDKYQLPPKSDEASPKPSIKFEEAKDDFLEGSRGRKHLQWEESVLEEQRSSKQSAIHVEEEEELCELLDKTLLCNDPQIFSLTCCNSDNGVLDGADKTLHKNGVANGAGGGRNRPRRKVNKSEAVDLRTLLVSCAQSVAANDGKIANEQLKQIRQHSSTSGDASQRLAHVFANGIEARLDGTGSQLYAPLRSRRRSATEMLKAYQVFLSASPFKLISMYFADKIIADLASKATTLHIVDFGILYGFQWLMLIQQLSTFPGGPPKLRITGIDYPQPGFRPAERVDETGQHLARFCDQFHVPFEYQSIATQNWEDIKIKDLKLEKDDVLVVNSLFRFRNLPDETVVTDCPRDAVLKLIKEMNPRVFVNAVINGSYSGPFFVTRFREALYHYTSLFDMFDATVPREDEQRLKFEQEFFGREILNIISCEGLERVERPETYKQWQVRHIRAGFKPFPLEQEFMNKLRCKVKNGYHKDFVFDEDGSWMLQGWKGRIICASSCWIPG